MTEATNKRGMYFAVQLGPDKNPSRGTVIAEAPATGNGIPQTIMDLWKPGMIAVVWSRPMEPPRKLPEASLASVRQKRLRRKLEKDVPLLADEIERHELQRRPDFYAGKEEPTRPAASQPAAGIEP